MTTKTRCFIRVILWCGVACAIWGLPNLVIAGNTRPFNLGVMLGYGAESVMGVLAALVAECLILIDKRLEKIENSKNSRE